ncbi:efflux RND transporter periplasmic adaptor subunit [Rhizobiaceae bacterium n13]|uniref:Efflux RND transporter periplasmic adaptor subunit n=2 Tax=Ferirhizobium litorale TaxID=2927786 RepID=A0AAE3QH62_9HYPH|nr:efflux RND transporter periplasmic adaptor subunit [Fererhizobium litorale]MDI7863222.1 efflux RND transporter periplasmic adaptor subunit [Fererhizobium litorale]MDI7923043.1 efflux RND transporter periplasmic adaptor subunit [Fererhizobium litorale]
MPDLASVLAGSSGKRKGKSRIWAPLLVALAVAGGIGAYSYLGGTGSSVTYTTQPVTRGDLSVLVTATGSVEPTEQVDISSELSGTVRSVNVNYNSSVKAGDVLAELDTNKLEADVKSARAKLNSAKATVTKSEAELGAAMTALDRLRNLVTNRVSTQQDLDSASYSHQAAAAAKEINEAAVLAAEADLRLAEVNLSKAKIVSPIDGVVLTRAVDPGATVAASLSAPVLFTIAGDLRKMELQVNVDEADVGRVAVGQQATFTVDSYPDKTFPAVIESVRFASETVNNVVTYMAVLSVDNGELLLRPGMTATADILTEKISDTLLVPNAALRYAPPRTATSSRSGIFGLFRPPRMGALTSSGPAGPDRSVWVLRNGVPAQVKVQVGASDGQSTVLVSGDLNQGEELITDSATKSR